MATQWSSAPCHGLVDLFFDERPEAITKSKSLCAGCELVKECLNGALERAEAYGVWGGTDYQERQAIAASLGYPIPKRKPDVDHGTSRGYAWHKRENVEIPLDRHGNDVCGCRSAYRADAKERVRRYRKRKREARQS